MKHKENCAHCGERHNSETMLEDFQLGLWFCSIICRLHYNGGDNYGQHQ